MVDAPTIGVGQISVVMPVRFQEHPVMMQRWQPGQVAGPLETRDLYMGMKKGSDVLLPKTSPLSWLRRQLMRQWTIPRQHRMQMNAHERWESVQHQTVAGSKDRRDALEALYGGSVNMVLLAEMLGDARLVETAYQDMERWGQVLDNEYRMSEYYFATAELNVRGAAILMHFGHMYEAYWKLIDASYGFEHLLSVDSVYRRMYFGEDFDRIRESDILRMAALVEEYLGDIMFESVVMGREMSGDPVIEALPFYRRAGELIARTASDAVHKRLNEKTRLLRYNQYSG